MQLGDLVTPIETQSDEELKARLFDLRHRREHERPAMKDRVKKAAKKEGRKASSAAEKLLANLSPEDLAALMKEMGA